ncbi:deoxyribonuclease IV [Aquibacillus koreensis]|uniref:Deoxyribonuclease IV n=1 Tax=Aquibacillus koreensis TaxID=279446 RepID=A0A9X4AKD4_9BACI|nr:deoxyribonuclease IV [Aquibacillus koreensis]MCT2536319.1 deoxyribonuclease IV [Aquibacillus koreensis]MDC3421330.1 deoxyribonuclease IV [Aquibacillus koreensis]
MRIGSHVSIREGYLGAAKQANQLQASVYQYFPKNPRSLDVKTWNKDDAACCKRYCVEHDMQSVSHTPYPTNLTAPEDKREKVIQSLLNDLEISEACGSIGAVVHFGKVVDKDNPIESYQHIIKTLNQTLDQWDGSCKILLENNAGGTFGTTIEELVQVRKLCHQSERIGFCLDTCHAFASGVWNGDNWKEIERNDVAQDFFDHLACVHFNNSKYPPGQGKDRHANILETGHITKTQWDAFIHSPYLIDVPFILETPDENLSHEEEIERIKLEWGIFT